MIYINPHGAPGPYERACNNNKYNRGNSDFTATGLANPPRLTVLIERNIDSIQIDIINRIDANLGTGFHMFMESGARKGIDLVEKRYFKNYEVSGRPFVVSAQIDFYESDTKKLYDWKTTKAFAFSNKASAKPEWIAQMNIGRRLMMEYGLEVNELWIMGVLKDWNYKSAEESGYPPRALIWKKLPIWPDEVTDNYIQKSIAAVLKAREELPLCTSAQTWGGNRCKRWCDASVFCTQYQESKRTGII